MSKARTLLAGASWTYGAQLLTVVAQFVYAAITSRIVDPDGFGTYAVSLTVAAFVSLLANGGLSQTVGRMQTVDRDTVRPLVLYALILGAAGALFLLATADLWATIWGVPEATTPIRWLSISAFLGPAVGLSTGLMRRIGRFRRLASLTLIANISGMVLGVAAVATFGTASALLVSPIAAQFLICTGAFAFSNGVLLGVRRLRHAREAIGYSWRITVALLISYLSGNVGSWAAARAFGAATLGQWNRADVVTHVPFQQVQNAMIQAIYPEFRHDINGPQRARVVWADLLALVAWVVLPIAAAGAVIVPHLVPILFGSGWELAAALAVPLSLIGGFQILVTMLGAAIEALGKFRWVWATQLTTLGVNLSSAVVAYITSNLVVIFLGIGFGLLVTHSIHITLCMRTGYLAPRKLLTNYLGAASAAIVAAALALGGVYSALLFADMPWILGVFSGGLLAAGWVLRRFIGHLPPVRIARSYGIL